MKASLENKAGTKDTRRRRMTKRRAIQVLIQGAARDVCGSGVWPFRTIQSRAGEYKN